MKKLLISVLSLFLFATSHAQSKVSVLYDGDFDFSTFATFDFSKATYRLGDQFKQQPYLAKTLITNLEEKGVKKRKGVVDAIVDVKVSYDRSINVSKQPKTVYSRYYGAPRARGRYVGTVYTKSIC